MSKEQLIIESNILMALFKATVEQSTLINGKLNQKPKQIFNTWQKLGFNLLDGMESLNIKNDEYLENLSDVIHNIIHELRIEHKKTFL